MHYKQCKMTQKNKEGLMVQTAWIPLSFTKIGSFVKLKRHNGWDDGWQVTSASDAVMTWEEVNERSQDHKKQRQASDI